MELPEGTFGYTDAQIRPYTFNLQPFLADKNAIQQGFLGSEPFSIEQAAAFQAGGAAGRRRRLQRLRQPDRHLGQDDRASSPDLVQRFVDASIEGWYSYLDGDPSPGNALIKKANPEMTDALIAYGRDAMKEHGILESGDALKVGIGAMTDARWADVLSTRWPTSGCIRRAWT